VFQISKVAPTGDAAWYAPLMADTETTHATESAWKGASNADYYAPGGQLTQQPLLQGQSTDAPVDTTYKYRARGVTKDITAPNAGDIRNADGISGRCGTDTLRP
jgi:hypothetical protein